jgi:PAS domain S-box-containing protein
VSSLHESHQCFKQAEKQDPSAEHTCWESLSCSKVLCPAYGKREQACWLTPRTHCSIYREQDFFQRLSVCLGCSFFKVQGELHPGGWNRFLADEVHKYNRKALEQLYQKEESYIEILNLIPDGLFTVDQDWRITFFNPAAENITGFSAADAVGMYCKDVLKGSICDTNCTIKRAIMGDASVRDQEFEITTIDGNVVPVICSASVFQDASGRLTGGLEIFKDITEQKRLQEEVVTREKKLRRIFEGSHDMIYTSNEQGRLLDVNQAGVKMLRYRNRGELLGIGSARRLYWNPADRGSFLEKINRDEYVKDYEVDFKAADGLPIHVLLSARRYENPETGDIEYDGIIKDITLRKQTEEILKKRNQELSLLNSVAVALNLTLDLKHILMVTLKEVLVALKLKRGALFVIDQKEKEALLQVRYGLPAEDPKFRGKVQFKDTLLMKHLIEDDGSITPEPTFPSFMAKYIARDDRRVPWLSSFLITFKGKGVGFFALDISPTRQLSEHELHLLGSLGYFLGGAIEHTQLLQTISRHRQELRRLTDKLFQGQEDERRRIARELHDEAGQALTAVKLGLDHLEEKVTLNPEKLLEEIGEIRRMVIRTSSEIRRLSYRLHPTLLSDLGLEPALNLYFKDVIKRSGLEIDFRMVGFDRRLNGDLETVLYRFAQETLTNTLKHSGAEKFKISIIRSYPKIIFLAEDDGIGFEGQFSRSGKRSLGLLGMRERASLIGGTFQLRSKKGEGTRIRIEIPLPEDHTDESND